MTTLAPGTAVQRSNATLRKSGLAEATFSASSHTKPASVQPEILSGDKALLPKRREEAVRRRTVRAPDLVVVRLGLEPELCIVGKLPSVLHQHTLQLSV